MVGWLPMTLPTPGSSIVDTPQLNSFILTSTVLLLLHHVFSLVVPFVPLSFNPHTLPLYLRQHNIHPRFNSPRRPSVLYP